MSAMNRSSERGLTLLTRLKCSRFGNLGNHFLHRPVIKLILSREFAVPTLLQKRCIWNASSSGKKDPYAVLGVSRSATPQEIKIAYFRKAKACHPDMNPGNPEANKQFQELSAAYDEIKNPSKSYDSSSSGTANQQQQQYYSSYSTEKAKDTFNDVWNDASIIKEAISLYASDVQEEVSIVVDAAKAGDWDKVWESAKNHKGVILGVLLPLALVLRFPAAIFLALRSAAAIAPILIAPLLRSGHAAEISKMIWRRIVAEARTKAAIKRSGRNNQTK